jgi:hypothetical protein
MDVDESVRKDDLVTTCEGGRAELSELSVLLPKRYHE